MPKVKVDGIEVEVPQCATVLQACEVAGKEIKKKMGVNIDAKGNIIENNDEEDYSTERENENNQKFDIFNGFNDDNNKMKNIKLKKEYTPINKYKPMGNFVYDDVLFEKIGKKMDFNR